jgi:hypothetical protein
VACAVRQQLNQARPPGRPCSEPKVGLIQTPSGVQQPVWDVVAPASLSAMDAKRRTMWFRHFNAATPPLLDVEQCVQAGCTRATLAFWLSPHHFVQVCSYLPLGRHAPFLYVSGQPPRLCLRLPMMVCVAVAPGGSEAGGTGWRWQVSIGGGEWQLVVLPGAWGVY